MLAHALFGISGSILYTPATAVVGHWFLRKRGTATGLVSTGVGLGGVIYPIMLNRLFDMVGTSSPSPFLRGCWVVRVDTAEDRAEQGGSTRVKDGSADGKDSGMLF